MSRAREVALTALAMVTGVVGALGVLGALLAWEAVGRGAGELATITLGLVAGGLALVTARAYLRRLRAGRLLAAIYAGCAVLHGLGVAFLLHAGVGIHTILLVVPIAGVVLAYTALAEELVQ